MKKVCKGCSPVISKLEGTLRQQRVQWDDMPRPVQIGRWIQRSRPTPAPKVRAPGSHWKVHRSVKTMIPGKRYMDLTSLLGLCCWAKCQFRLQPGRSLRKFAEQKAKPQPQAKLKQIRNAGVIPRP